MLRGALTRIVQLGLGAFHSLGLRFSRLLPTRSLSCLGNVSGNAGAQLDGIFFVLSVTNSTAANKTQPTISTAVIEPYLNYEGSAFAPSEKPITATVTAFFVLEATE
ncbi:hypothetical protein ABIF65_006615 [Bradyrhizobium japonicum]|uniref:hypothetical protein n=1 Tax=Bradyrhizobium TaxID=374 RepID=UPI0012BB7CE7|nr:MULTISPECIES: hypothetical protein [Bradyrhizobium]MBR0883752.1 hypothetical protein [Bradyrhizobium liaoningense]MBR0947845.1 hypothetical protein [Bradyrhizobium liaoningense]MBR1003835.1 hypothetical protein [Bradyrhizobium liaoningense]MBR1032716.1 hypothetical protein [Bradyrhizobium liaoningense]MBR1070110.1 hypothetical protein [Bradyrhizobium liaoningense]